MINDIVNGLLPFLQEVDNEDYTMPCSYLSGASIGQHVRHSIEMYQCLLAGYAASVVCYANRKRDAVLETSSVHAVDCFHEILQQLPAADRQLSVLDGNEMLLSSFKRELHYCNEHLVHHMALIKVAIHETGRYNVPPTFGVAASTIKFREQCAQ